MRTRGISARRLIGIAAACTAALAPVAGLVATTALATPAVARSTAACTTSGLVVWLDTRGGGAAGSIYYHLELTNLSGHTCTLFGYPGVSAVDLRGRRVGSPASRNAAQVPRKITLATDSTATVVLRIGNADNFPATVCRPTLAAGLRVYPPNQRSSKTVPFPFRACSRTGSVYLTVEPVQKP